ncbi:MAG: hypothetical protein LBV80_07385 [Deltaproteobacteria bacterium]|jgi:hypothetical protein|nr:hypothetical protein [Deltaproteobacteria bacterium]
MYINLILGFAALVALIWLAWRLLRRDQPPSRMLLDEISRRRNQQTETRQGLERLGKIRARHLDLVEAGLADMSRGLADLDPNCKLAWERKEDRIALRFLAHPAQMQSPALPPALPKDGILASLEEFGIRWDVQDLDLERLNASDSQRSIPGEYSLSWNGGGLRERDLHEFMRAVSALVADRLHFTG